MGGMVEEGFKSSKIMSYSTIKATTEAIQSGTRSLLGKKKKYDVAMFISRSWRGPAGLPHQFTQPRPQPQAYTQAPYNPPQHYLPPQDPQYSSPEAPNINQKPLPANSETHMIEIVHKNGEPKNSSKSAMMIQARESNPVKDPDSAKEMPLIVEGVSEKLSTRNVKPSVLVVKGPPIDVEANQEK
uniref:Uncharacterized protein n=1 Tax=Nicotiana tabacum TaxID=4097 RepID=A0A1S3ZER2_TOBAC|nr:PREDICTED: uncharacterized protein LOC107785926 [Nicotiana tabacum]